MHKRMTTHIIPLESLQKIQKFLRAALVLPEAENCPKPPVSLEEMATAPIPTSLADLGDLFRMGSSFEDGGSLPNDRGRWFLSIFDVAPVIQRLPGLSVAPGYRFATYLYRLPDQGIGHTVALPEQQASLAQLMAVLPGADKPEMLPQPVGALPDLMATIVGDRSPMTYLLASMLKRELAELGRVGEVHAIWQRHRYVAAAPTQARWQWRSGTAPDLRPRVRIMPDDRVTVEFFSCRVHPSIAIFQHLDQYEPDSYVPQSLDRPLAFAEQRAEVSNAST
jgi:hypothetical protein